MWNKILFAKVPIVGIGLVAGIVSSMFGVGGGIILVPMLIYLLNFDIHEAVGTSLLIIIPTPDESPIIENVEDSTKYWRDDRGILHVPKRKLDMLTHRNLF